MRKYSLLKITIGQGDEYATGCLVGYPYFKESYKLIAIDLTKQQALYAFSKAIQEVYFTENLIDWAKQQFYSI